MKTSSYLSINGTSSTGARKKFKPFESFKSVNPWRSARQADGAEVDHEHEHDHAFVYAFNAGSASRPLISSGTTLAHETYNTPDTRGRYVRLIGHGNTVNLWNSLTEVEVFGHSPALTAVAGGVIVVDGRSGTNCTSSPWAVMIG